MRDIHHLEAAALSGNLPIEALLEEALGVAERRDDRAAIRWIAEELRGYTFEERIPPYRIVRADVGTTVDRQWSSLTWTNSEQERLAKVWSLDQPAPQIERTCKDSVAILKPLDKMAVRPHVKEDLFFSQPELRVTVQSLRDVLKQVRRRVYEWAASIDTNGTLEARNAQRSAAAGREVFIVHGRNHTIRDKVDLYLTKDLGLTTVVMQAGAMRGLTLPEKFEQAAKRAAFAVFLLTADDTMSIDGRVFRRARQNVVLEIGYFWGLLGRQGNVAFLVEDHPDMELPSDIVGIGLIPITSDLGETKLRLRQELEVAGIITG
jgi:predicted nucleotide-binding protein